MVRAVIQYEREPDLERYARHVEDFAVKVDCEAFRHGKAFGAALRRAGVRVLRRVRVGLDGSVQVGRSIG